MCVYLFTYIILRQSLTHLQNIHIFGIHKKNCIIECWFDFVFLYQAESFFNSTPQLLFDFFISNGPFSYEVLCLLRFQILIYEQTLFATQILIVSGISLCSFIVSPTLCFLRVCFRSPGKRDYAFLPCHARFYFGIKL